MFEIPDDDDEFWKNLPMGDNLMECKSHASKSPFSGINDVEKQTQPDGSEKRFKLGISNQDLRVNSMPNAFQNKSNLRKQPCVSSSREPGVSGNDQSTDRVFLSKVKDIFNLTQSSTESDLDLSLNSECDSRRAIVADSSDRLLAENRLDIFPTTCGSHSAKEFVQNSTTTKTDHSNFICKLRTTFAKNSPSLDQRNSHWTTDIVNHRTSNFTSPSDNVLPRPCDPAQSDAFLTPVKRPNFSSRVTSTPYSDSYQTSCQSTPNRPTQEVRVEKESPFCSNSKGRRKFPGPAGHLPKLVAGQSLDTNQVLVLNSPLPQKKEPVITSSQYTEDVFNDPPWQMLQSDLGEECQSILHRFSIQNTVNKAQQKQLPNGKVPLLFGVVDTLDVQGADGSVSLRDKTGKMQGTVHRELLKECECQLQLGVVIVLKQVAVISPTQRTHYLNITPNNVISVYRNNGDGTAMVSLNNSDHLLSQVQALETQLRETPVPQTPQLGQLLSQPRTPVHRVFPSPALFQTVQQSPGYNSTPNFRGQFDSQPFKQPQRSTGTPQFHPTPHNQGTPQYHPNTPNCHSKSADLEPRTPQFQIRTPQFQVRTPQFQVRTPQFQVRTPQFQARTSQYPAQNSPGYGRMKAELRTPKPGTSNPYHASQLGANHSDGANDLFAMSQWDDSELPIPPSVNICGSETRSPLKTKNDNLFIEPNSPNLNQFVPAKQTKSKWTFKPRNSPNLSVSSQSDSVNDIASPVYTGKLMDYSQNKVASETSTCTSRSDNYGYGQRQCLSNTIDDSNNNQLKKGSVVNTTYFMAHPPNKVPRLNSPTCTSDSQNVYKTVNKIGSDRRNNLPEIGLKPSSNLQMEVDNLWQDDLTDELLKDFTAEDFP